MVFPLGFPSLLRHYKMACFALSARSIINWSAACWERPESTCGKSRIHNLCPPRQKPRAPVIRLAVVGAHLSGQPLNYQLLERGARLVCACRTHACYRLYTLANTTPPKPGLVRSDAGDGVAIAIEVWEMPVEEFGSFVAQVPPPLSIGSVLLEDGQVVKGFLCEGYAIQGAHDISSFGGWREFLQHGDPVQEPRRS